MTIRPLACALAVLAGFAPALSFAQELPDTRDLERIGLVNGWWARAVVDSKQDELEHIRSDEQVVLVQSRQGLFTAFRADSGRILWSVLLGGPKHRSFPAVMNETEVVVAVGLNMFSLNKSTGETMWELRLPGHPSCTPEIDSNQVYVGTTDGSVYAYSLRTIRELFSKRKLPAYTHMAQVWRYKTPEAINAIVSNGTVVDFTSSRGTLYGVDARERSLRYQIETTGTIRTPMGRNQNALFIPTSDGRMTGLSLDSGRVRWEFTAGTEVLLRPRAIGNSVYVSPTRAGLFCLESESGAEIWRQRAATEFTAASDDRVYAFDTAGKLLVLELATGRVTGSIPMRQFEIHYGNELTDRILVATTEGLVASFHEQGRTLPVFHRNPDRRPLLPDMAPDEAAEGTAEPAPQTN
ncbi:outer membrane biogenesis protein BamB [Caulifigura coniformis]|uniref:Outer membrane biogenesis protein BamB n=1 Tax=Caulifigura coniformis TaxID=2527983 RepID=A0A517SHW7_9PLAN|nr:PQQ-binding-like beta-propeller repeat protein [Caulifigura coniformis]QDT55718.1 outer membrane biogenesis protein BamB [Caulifigura coniformis]